ncbi:MAG: ABC transporter ATP-binding protein, partial [Cyanobacteria bacterium J06639_18]
MSLKITKSVRNLIKQLVKATSFWQDNYLILREFKSFRRITIKAIFFSIIAATFEGFSIGFLLNFLQQLTSNGASETGIAWLDTLIQNYAPGIDPIYIISFLILLSTWI